METYAEVAGAVGREVLFEAAYPNVQISPSQSLLLHLQIFEYFELGRLSRKQLHSLQSGHLVQRKSCTDLPTNQMFEMAENLVGVEFVAQDELDLFW